jgi:hypothetical protein
MVTVRCLFLTYRCVGHPQKVCSAHCSRRQFGNKMFKVSPKRESKTATLLFPSPMRGKNDWRTVNKRSSRSGLAVDSACSHRLLFGTLSVLSPSTSRGLQARYRILKTPTPRSPSYIRRVPRSRPVHEAASTRAMDSNLFLSLNSLGYQGRLTH